MENGGASAMDQQREMRVNAKYDTDFRRYTAEMRNKTGLSGLAAPVVRALSAKLFAQGFALLTAELSG